MSLSPFRCYSEKCKSSGATNSVLYLDSRLARYEPCPNCNEKGQVHAMDVIHLIKEDPNGSIQGAPPHSEGKRFNFLCERSRIGFTHGTSHPHYPHKWSDTPSAATCVDCLLTHGSALVGTALKQGA